MRDTYRAKTNMKQREDLTRRPDAKEMGQKGEGNENERRTRWTAALHAETRKTSKSKTTTRHSCERANKRVTKEKTQTAEHPHTSQSISLHQADLHPSQLSKHSGPHGTCARDQGYDEWRGQQWNCDQSYDQERERRMDRTEKRVARAPRRDKLRRPEWE